MRSKKVGHFRITVIWTQWYVGFWWWPVRKDQAIGVELGPLAVTWHRYPYWKG